MGQQWEFCGVFMFSPCFSLGCLSLPPKVQKHAVRVIGDSKRFCLPNRLTGDLYSMYPASRPIVAIGSIPSVTLNWIMWKEDGTKKKSCKIR